MPNVELLSEDYVLIQAWKKTAAYIRYHGWFCDTLALDHAAVNLPEFLGDIRRRLRSSEIWQNEPLRIVPAPKGQQWRIDDDGWKPTKKTGWARLRPLAHVNLADQVVATALMLCLADRVETSQGDSRSSIKDPGLRRKVVSYGNRLYCDAIGSELRHRWGSTKLYRAYYQDYRSFLARPEEVAKSIPKTDDKRLFVVHADFQQFYDRVRPEMLSAAVRRIRRNSDDPEFFTLLESVFGWNWDPRDLKDIDSYSKSSDLSDFSRVALPQGLVASGFFANALLLSFDNALREAIGSEIAGGIVIEDVCRYVDDLRILVSVDYELSIELGEIVSDWLERLLWIHAAGLKLSDEKLQVATLEGDERPLLRQRAKMNRIQSAVSGGFDARGGAEILDAIQGLMRAQDATRAPNSSDWNFAPIPDVKDETVARFGAARFRTTFRSIRPLLNDENLFRPNDEEGDELPEGDTSHVPRTKSELDGDAKVFALGLIQRWIDDPSNVRLLRIALDLWPDVELLNEVLSLLRPYTEKGGRRGAPRRVAWYCFAELLRAGATETGLVSDAELLPSGLDIGRYRTELCKEAVRLTNLSGSSIPWFLKQQALLFLAAHDPAAAPFSRAGRAPETRRYRELIQFLRRDVNPVQAFRSSNFATLAVLARRAFVGQKQAAELTRPGLNTARLRELARKDPSFLLELIDQGMDAAYIAELPGRVREDLCLVNPALGNTLETLATAVLDNHPKGELRNELSILRFSNVFLERLEGQQSSLAAITPGRVELTLNRNHRVAHVSEVVIRGSRIDSRDSLYRPPSWCNSAEWWRFQLGFLLRFILSGQRDPTQSAQSDNATRFDTFYRPAASHWYKRLFGLFNGQPAFGDDWLPITEWLEGFLLALLRWPGCRIPEGFDWVNQGIQETKTQIGNRITYLENLSGRATGELLLPLMISRPNSTLDERPLRACVVQTVIPSDEEFSNSDLALNGLAIRQSHRNHLSSALAAVERMLLLRATHENTGGQLDWLILPELAVHPDDIRTHLIPFARAHKAQILAGLTYDEVIEGEPLINSALWIIPEWSDAHGLQMRIRRQGKRHLAPDEKRLNECGAPALMGFRPCQWLIGYPWSNEDARPVWLTASVCYDATDLRMASDLKEASDVLAIPALNKDVRTFDQMALALHYHMFQLVVVANNGRYGGSSAYWPRSNSHRRQVFHMHGQPQASMAFLEIDDIGEFLNRRDVSGPVADEWKYPPAGLGLNPA